MKSADVESLRSSPRIVDRASAPSVDADAIAEVIRLIRSHTGRDFTEYKPSLISRRVAHRMHDHGVHNVSTYLRLLQTTPTEGEELFRDLLIGVTGFFRDNTAWEDLSGVAIPEMLARNSEGGVLRAWVPGCATGEEAYSLAISFRETIERLPTRAKFTVQIVATDINVDAVEHGKSAVFASSISRDVSPERLERFFVREEGGYRLCPEIRAMVTFSPQDLVMDAPFTRFDLISCRNLLIYHTRPLQQRLLGVLHDALRTNGTLFLGLAESIGSATGLFTPVSLPSRIFRRIDAGAHTVRTLPVCSYE